LAVGCCLQPPTPGAGEVGEPKKAASEQPQNQSAGQDRGAPNDPIFVKIVPPEKTDTERAEDRKKENEKSAIDRSVVRFTEDLATYTAFLFGATAVLALATGGLVFAGFKQLRDTKRIIIAAEKSAMTAERALTDLERAYVFVSIYAHYPNFATLVNNATEKLFDVHVTISASNHGKTPAILRKVRGYLQIPDVVPQSLIEIPNAVIEFPDGLAISSAEPYRFTVDHRITNDEWIGIQNANKHLYCVGVIGYSDVLGSTWETGYCWKLTWRQLAPEFHIVASTPLNYRT
jgi:hypothetical protein